MICDFLRDSLERVALEIETSKRKSALTCKARQTKLAEY